MLEQAKRGEELGEPMINTMSKQMLEMKGKRVNHHRSLRFKKTKDVGGDGDGDVRWKSNEKRTIGREEAACPQFRGDFVLLVTGRAWSQFICASHLSAFRAGVFGSQTLR